MNTFAGVMLLLWVGGWTLAMLRAGLIARTVALAPVPEEKLLRTSAGVNR